MPPEDIFAKHNIFTKWITHPIKRRLARNYLRYLKKNTGIKVIGITGSTGKTTTTEILASILRNNGKTVWSAEGVDPVYNIPNTILRATPKTKYLILEMSVEYVNEMDYYLWLAKPDIGVVTNINTSHTEFLKDVKGVACEKGKLIESLGGAGVAILNKEDEMTKILANNTRANILYFGKSGDISASGIRFSKDLSTDFTLEINSNKKSIHMDAFGGQFVKNALAASGAAHVLGIDINSIARGIELFKRPTHRLNVFMSKSHGLIFDDTYNSNPAAATESLDTFSVIAKEKKKVAVIGDMLELGKFEEAAHRQIGKKVGEMKFNLVVGVGAAAKYIIDEVAKKMPNEKYSLVGSYSEALEIVKPLLGKDSALFVKGSRAMHLDKLVDVLS